MKKLIFPILLATLAAAAGAQEETAGEAKPASDNPVVVLETSKGNIVLELDIEKAPKTVENFLAYVESGHFENTIFHRVIPDFMVQGGGMTKDLKQKDTRPPIQNEADNGLKNDRGTIAMARTSDPHSASAQWFINSVDNDFLNHTGKNTRGWGYAVFGKVIEGMEVVDAISAVKTTRRGSMGDVPMEPIFLVKATKR